MDALILSCGTGGGHNSACMLRMKQKYWYISAISAALTIIFAVLVLINPFSAVASLWTFIGVTMIIEAVLDIVTFICGRNEKKLGAAWGYLASRQTAPAFLVCIVRGGESI